MVKFFTVCIYLIIILKTYSKILLFIKPFNSILCWSFQFGVCRRRGGWEWMERHHAATQWKGNIRAVKIEGVMYISDPSAWSYHVLLSSRKPCLDTMCLRACATYGLPGKEPFAKQGTVWCMYILSIYIYIYMCFLWSLYMVIWL